MPPATYKITEARARLSELLDRAKAGEEIVITKHDKPQARSVPPTTRELAPLRHLRLPDDLFDREDAEQAAIDAGDDCDALGIWRGRPAAS